PLHHPLAFKQFESNLFNALIYGQPNNALHKLDHYKEKTVSPYFVKRTEAYIKEHLHDTAAARAGRHADRKLAADRSEAQA
ncbi:hypothetical protein ACTXQV_71800, partial [Klebsiella pneumoniae]